MRLIISNALAIFAISIALTTLCGYLVNRIQLAAWVDGGTPMAVSTAVAIITLGLAVIVRRWRLKPDS